MQTVRTQLKLTFHGHNLKKKAVVTAFENLHHNP